MSATRLWFRAETGREIPPGPVACWLCGLSCKPEDTVAAESVIRDTFSDHDRARSASDRCCVACAAYLDFKVLRPGQKRGMGLYTKSVLVIGSEWREWDRESMAADLLRWWEYGLPDAAALACNFSKQKHVLPWARVNPAGTRRFWVETDHGRVRVSDGLPVMVAAVADLWSRGYGKTALASAQLTPFVLARSPDPAGDLAVCAALEHRNPIEIEMATYVVTEENRDGLSRELAPLLPRAESRAATRGDARRDPERGGRPQLQESVRPPLVGHVGGAREAVCHDERRPDPVEQLALL